MQKSAESRRSRITEVSNELEFCIAPRDGKGSAAAVINSDRSGRVTPEVNPLHVVELNISRKSGIRELNAHLPGLVGSLIRTADECGCMIYSGSSVLSDISAVEPRKYRTTMLSKSLGRGLLSITSQQIVIGVNDSSLGFRLYNTFRLVNPVLLALSASSPYSYGREGGLESSGYQSRRMPQYERMCSFLPEAMYRDEPHISGMREYSARLGMISDEVNVRLSSGRLDTDSEAIAMESGKGLFPFDRLQPHQLYNPTRIRPDHDNRGMGGESVMSIELRVCDIPTTTLRMQTINAFVLGLAHYVELSDGSLGIPAELDGSFRNLMAAARGGARAAVDGENIGAVTQRLGRKAGEGLRMAGCLEEAEELRERLDYIASVGNDAMAMGRSRFDSPDHLRAHLAERLRKGE
jgi:gamma-glutamyl:cysteine ligase YbdK (ATP-grasp superfamily)